MRLLILHIIFLLGFSNLTLAQDAGRLEAYKIAYLTKKLNLTPQEAERFWPIYNKYQNELKTVRVESKQKNGGEIELEEKVLNIRKKYNDQFTKALTPDKVNQLYKSEKEFGNIVQRELLERRQRQNDNRKKKN